MPSGPRRHTVKSDMHPAVQISEVRARPTRSDVLLVAGLLVWALLEAVLANPGGPVWARVLAACGYTLPLLVRRRYPLVALLLIGATAALRAYTTDVADKGAMPFPALLVATFSVGLYVRQLWLSLLGGSFPIVLVLALNWSPMWSGERFVQDYAILIFFVSAAWVGGYVIRRRAAQIRAAEAAGGERARAAVAAERSRIARELHDIVAHSVSIIALQAGAGEALVERDPEAAREHMAAVRKMAHDAMGEMRRLLDVLREDDAVYEPTPDLRDLESLVEASRAAGVPVAFESDARDLQAGVALTVYRVVQESLTNIRKHAGPVQARVRIRRSRDHVDVVVENDAGALPAAAVNGAGYGLVGMRERLRVYGGTLEASRVDDGGFRVAASIPLSEDEA
jgi:signal transduction histidine kinase